MSHKFDLTCEPWLPARTLNGRIRTCSLRDTLADAHRLRELDAGSPLEMASLYRFLQALTLRIFASEMADYESWADLLEDGCFDAGSIDAYFEEWRERFDLLHSHLPFYQHPEPLTDNPSALAQLFPQETSGNNPTLFGHEFDDTDRHLGLDDAARGIVTTQATTLGGGHSKPFYYSDAPLAAGAVFWIRGKNLFEALVLNSPPVEMTRMGHLPDMSSPSWEISPPSSERRAEAGYLDYLTWQSRRLRLAVSDGPDGPTATGVYISQGDKKEGGGDDPLMAYRISRKGGIYPLSLRKDQALWRDAHIFLRVFSKQEGGAPPALSWIANNEWQEPALRGRSWEVDIFGIVNDQAKIELWRHERLPFYPSILRDGARYELLRQALDRAERQADNLREATRYCAAVLLYPGKIYGELSKQARKEVRDLAESLDAVSRFWPRLEARFYVWLDSIAGNYDAVRAPAEWTRTLFYEALNSYGEATESLDTSARHHHARVEGRARLRPAAAFADILADDNEEVTL